MDTNRPTIAISMGDPAGIGPEVVVKALVDPEIRQLAQWLVVGDRWVLEEEWLRHRLPFDRVITDIGQLEPGEHVVVLDESQITRAERIVGQVSPACGRAALHYVRTAANLCLARRSAAMVTGPLSKEAVALNGIPFTGHTEFIAELCGVSDSRLMLVHDRICVVHVTTHCRLADAVRLDSQRILRTIELGNEALLRLRGFPPRVAVCGLNPHAGENGLFGDEETLFIAPAIAGAKAQGIDCHGPFPADTLFMQAVRGSCDLVVAMYHDQGHVPMKLFDFEHTVNVTLGLPIIRTSVDHGTAMDIAGKGIASAEDMQTAMRMAVRMIGECRSQ